MRQIEPGHVRQSWRQFQWPVLWGLGLVVLGLGAYGFQLDAVAAKKTRTFLDCFYAALQLFLLSAGELASPVNWELQVARFLAPTVAAYTATQALLVIFKEQFEMLRLRFLRRGHVVICGLGRKGFRLAMDFRRKGHAVVVIELESENDWLRRAEEIGCLVLIGDATDEDLLLQARFLHANRLIPVCGNDGINVEIAVRACQLKSSEAERGGPMLHCHVHIVDPDLRKLFQEHRVFTDTGDQFKVTLFNIYESSARLMLNKHPLDRVTIAPDDPRSPRLVVIGFGQMGESIVLQAAKSGHYANGRPLHIVAVDQQASDLQRHFRRRHPHLDRVCKMEFFQREVDDSETLAQVAAWCQDASAITTVVISFDDDARCLALALILLPKIRPLGVPLLLRMATDGGLTTLLHSEPVNSKFSRMVHPFGMIDLSSSEEILLQEDTDALAMAIHSDYVKQRMKEGGRAETDAALLPWDELDEDLRDSNRRQADHIPIKLRAIGCHAASTATDGGREVTAFTAEQVEILARMEHARWCAERHLAGWTFAAGPKNIEAKTSPHLVPWEKLSDAIKEYDRQAVATLPKLVGLGGQRIVAIQTAA